MNVILYSTATCPHCKQLAELMNEKKIPFTPKFLEDTDTMIEMLMVGSTRNSQRWNPPILSVDGRFVEAGTEAEWIENFEGDEQI